MGQCRGLRLGSIPHGQRVASAGTVGGHWVEATPPTPLGPRQSGADRQGCFHPASPAAPGRCNLAQQTLGESSSPTCPSGTMRQLGRWSPGPAGPHSHLPGAAGKKAVLPTWYCVAICTWAPASLASCGARQAGRTASAQRPLQRVGDRALQAQGSPDSLPGCCVVPDRHAGRAASPSVPMAPATYQQKQGLNMACCHP